MFVEVVYLVVYLYYADDLSFVVELFGVGAAAGRLELFVEPIEKKSKM